MSLKELLGEELYQQVIEKAGDQKLAIVSDGNWFPKEKFDAVNIENKDYKKQILDRDTQLENLKKKAKGNEDLTGEIERLRLENQAKATEYQANLDKQAFDFKLTEVLAGAQSKNTKSVIANLNLESIKLDGDKLIGLDDQLTALKESDPYLFGETKKEEIGGGSNGGTERTDKTKDQQLKEAAETYKKSGRIEDMAAYSSLERELRG